MTTIDADFVRFACWGLEAINRVIPVTAENPSDAAFLATHLPVAIRRTESGTSTRLIASSEEVLLSDFLDASRLFTFVPITGHAGSGKSHLVRWLASRIPPAPDRKVVVVHKYQTDLRSVVRRILDGMSGAVYEEFRDRLDRTAASLQPAQARQQLIDTLAFLIGPENEENKRDGLSEPQQFVMDKLPQFIGDPLIKQQLTADGKVIDRLVREALEGRGLEDKEAPYQITVQDLDLPFNRLPEINRDGQMFYRGFGADEGLKYVAVDWLNVHLSSALKSLYGFSSHELRELIRDLRKQIHKEDKELILLIEDFAVLQGIQGELLDAILEDTEVRGVQELCTIRTALAVTSGYFDTWQTVKQRATFIVDMDVPTDSADEWQAEHANDFFGRYLNAARIGEKRLSEVLRSSPEDQRVDGDWLPNACTTCPHRAACFDAFGATHDGIGLYPFNSRSVETMTRQVSNDTVGHFNPRIVLRNILAPVLSEGYGEIKRGDFPGSAISEHFYVPGLPLDVLQELQSKINDPNDLQRFRRALTLWADGSDASSLRQGVIDAFDLPRVHATKVNTDTKEQTRDTDPPPPPPSPPPQPPRQEGDSKAAARWKRLNDWLNGEADLTQSDARDFRNLVFDCVTENIDWSVVGVSPVYARKNAIWSTASICLPGDRSQQRDTHIELDLGAFASDRAEIASAIRWLDYSRNGREYETPPVRDLITLGVQLDQWQAEVTLVVQQAVSGEGDHDPLTQVLEFLTLSASVLGEPMDNANEPEVLDTLLRLPNNALLSSTPGNHPWPELIRKIGPEIGPAREALLSFAGITKGTPKSDSEPKWLDASRILPALETALQRATPRESTRQSVGLERIRRANESLSELPSLMSKSLEHIEATRDALAPFQELEEVNPTQLSERFMSIFGAATQAGVLRPSGKHLEIEAAIERLSNARLSAHVERVSHVVSCEGGAQLRALAQIDYSLFEGLAQKAQFIDSVVTDTLQYSEEWIAGHERTDESIDVLSGSLQAALESLLALEGNADDDA